MVGRDGWGASTHFCLFSPRPHSTRADRPKPSTELVNVTWIPECTVDETAPLADGDNQEIPITTLKKEKEYDPTR